MKNHEKWKSWEEKNKNPYGKCCVDVARQAMVIIDRDFANKPITKGDVHSLICKAGEETNAGGITGFMAGAAASMISLCSDRGEEFRKAWNLYNCLGDEKQAEKVNESGGVINPALLTIETKGEPE